MWKKRSRVQEGREIDEIARLRSLRATVSESKAPGRLKIYQGLHRFSYRAEICFRTCIRMM